MRKCWQEKNFLIQPSFLFSSWGWTWAVGFGDIISRYVKVSAFDSFFWLLFPFCLIISLLRDRFHKSGKWIFVLHDDMLEFHSKSVRVFAQFVPKFHASLRLTRYLLFCWPHCSNFLLKLLELKLLMSGQYIPGSIAIAIHFQTVTNFDQCQFQIFIQRGITLLGTCFFLLATGSRC